MRRPIHSSERSRQTPTHPDGTLSALLRPSGLLPSSVTGCPSSHTVQQIPGEEPRKNGAVRGRTYP